MRSTFAGLNTVVRGLYAQQVGLDTVGHNISNANTPGYSRQTVNLATTTPGVIFGAVGKMQIGTGVDITSITRIRDSFLDKQMWKENSTLGYSESVETTLGKIENVFKDQLPDIGIQTTMNKFWTAWQTLSTKASDDSARLAVREQGDALVSTIKNAATQITNMVTDINSNLDIKVKSINQISSEIFSLNRQISNVEVGNRDHANDLRDRRDLLIDQLSKLGEVRVTEDKDHKYSVQFGDLTLVGDSGTVPLKTTSTVDSYYGFEMKSIVTQDGQAVHFNKGELGALIGDASNGDSFVGIAGAKKALDKLDTISKFLMTDFNAVHKAGYGTDDLNNRNFFDNKATASVADTNYNAVGFTPPVGGWISLLKVDRDLYATGGLAKIAAKTAPSLSITQSDATAGKANISGTYTGAAGTFVVSIGAVDATTNKVTQINYSFNGGPVVNLTPITGTEDTFQLPDGLTIAIAANTNNTAGDNYTFNVPYRGNASGDNAVNLSNALKVTTFGTLNNTTLDEYYAGFIGEIGIQSQNATRITENQQTLIDQITTWRESISGVNVDEEFTNMIRFQKGYNSAARIMTTMDEMLDKLINGTGVVGR